VGDQRRSYVNFLQSWSITQIFVACGIALDAFYDKTGEFASHSHPCRPSQTEDNGKSRDRQIAEVIALCTNCMRTATGHSTEHFGDFKVSDMAVHPSLELKQAAVAPISCRRRPGEFSGVQVPMQQEDALKSTMEMRSAPCTERKAGLATLINEIGKRREALVQLKVVTWNAS